MKFSMVSELFNNLGTQHRLETLIDLYNEMKLTPIGFCNALKEEINAVSGENSLCPICGDNLIIHHIKEIHDKEDPTKTEKIAIGYCQYCRKDFTGEY